MEADGSVSRHTLQTAHMRRRDGLLGHIIEPSGKMLIKRKVRICLSLVLG